MTANLRILSTNAADTATSLVASTTASASLAASNLRTDLKSEVWRSTGTTATLTLAWSAAVSFNCVVLPCTNFSNTATLRVQTTGGTGPYDSGTLACCPGNGRTPWGWTAAQLNVNSYGFGGGRGARLWLPAGTCTGMVITITDTSNPLGYLEASRLMLGTYWESSKNVDYEASLTPVDDSKHFRSDAGDLLTDVGFRHDEQSLPLSKMSNTDRSTLLGMVKSGGLAQPVFLSLYPEDNGSLEQDHMMWCKLKQSPAFRVPSFALYATTLDFDQM